MSTPTAPTPPIFSNIAGVEKTCRARCALLTQQLNTGKKSLSLVNYGVQGSRLLDLRADIQRREGYLDAIKAVTPDVKAYDKVFNSMETLDQQHVQCLPQPVERSADGAAEQGDHRRRYRRCGRHL